MGILPELPRPTGRRERNANGNSAVTVHRHHREGLDSPLGPFVMRGMGERASVSALRTMEAVCWFDESCHENWLGLFPPTPHVQTVVDAVEDRHNQAIINFPMLMKRHCSSALLPISQHDISRIIPRGRWPAWQQITNDLGCRDREPNVSLVRPGTIGLPRFAARRPVDILGWKPPAGIDSGIWQSIAEEAWNPDGSFPSAQLARAMSRAGMPVIGESRFRVEPPCRFSNRISNIEWPLPIRPAWQFEAAPAILRPCPSQTHSASPRWRRRRKAETLPRLNERAARENRLNFLPVVSISFNIKQTRICRPLPRPPPQPAETLTLNPDN